ncbi:NTF2 fold immunity protein [Pseudomonas sp. X4]|uniref:NTF2 fold immunity protein n=1 Tax=unclassified Pseudomonas TaxID=196821 RepID=UPI00345F3781
MTPTEKLQQFITSMLEWETTLDKLKKTKEYNDDPEVRNNILQSKRSELFEIFTNSLTSRAFKNIAKGRLDILATARPPEYAQEILENTLETDDRTTLICTHNKKSILPYRRYTLITKNEDTRIDKVEGRISANEEWHNVKSI